MTTPADRLIVSCEHAGNDVPPAYAPLFAGHEQLLRTHRGWDPGALLLAEEMAERFHAPLYFDTTTRLLADLNRSVGTPDLFSEVTRNLPLAERRTLLDRHYFPHRRRAEGAIDVAVAAGARVVHVASHSFTPELNGHVRSADIGLLYHPKRPGEVAFASHWLAALRAHDPALRLRRNYPDLGNSDGLCQAMRRRHAPDCYVGIELEVNQRYVEQGGPAWPKVRQTLLASLADALAAFAATPERKGAASQLLGGTGWPTGG